VKFTLRLPFVYRLTFVLFTLPILSGAQSQVQAPQFTGGEAAMFKFIAQNVVYPSEAVDANISGRVYITFMVEIDGTTNGFEVYRGLNPSYGMNDEALRVAKLLTGFQPAMENGTPVQYKITLPFNFCL